MSLLSTSMLRVVGVLVLALISIAALWTSTFKSLQQHELLTQASSPSELESILDVLRVGGYEFRVDENKVYVSSKDIGNVRNTLIDRATSAKDSRGYELLESVNRFGVSSRLFDATLHRAKIGEIENTIKKSGIVQDVRVHISSPEARRNSGKKTAAIFISPNKSKLTPQEAMSFRQLVASSIHDLALDNVILIDAKSNSMFENSLHDTQQNEISSIEGLQVRIEKILLQAFHRDDFEVGINYAFHEKTLSSEDRIIEPESKITLRESTVEQQIERSDSGNANVTTASNVPNNSNESTSDSNEKTDLSNSSREFGFSERIVRTSAKVSEIESLSIGIIILETAFDGISNTEIDITIGKLEKLIKASVGFNEERGDNISIQVINSFVQSRSNVPNLVQDRSSLALFAASELLRFGVFILTGLLAFALFLIVGRSSGKPTPKDDELLNATLPPLEDLDQGEVLISDNKENADFDLGLPSLSGGNLPNVLSGHIFDQKSENDIVLTLTEKVIPSQPSATEIIREWMK